MNNELTTVLICWQTRNWHHEKRAVDWCKDYGLQSILKNVWIGQLTPKERKDSTKAVDKIFPKPTEKVYLIELCKECFDRAKIPENTRYFATAYSGFEITNNRKSS